ncbi:Sec1-like protein [Clavulina sp. PMI_390]|nr:Sec1-like protein [Clavulina sp. PMI_390]
MPHPPHAPATQNTAKPDPTSPSVDVSALRDVASRGLVDVLNSVNGAKTLVLDPSLAGPLNLVTDVSLLKHHGVDRMYWLESGPITASTTNVVYLCRPKIKWMKIVADQIKQTNNSSSSHSYTLILVPRRTTLCDRILEEEGVLGDLTITSYKLEFIPLEDDLLSLELDNVWRELQLDGDDTSIFYSSQALLTLQQAFGLFPRILGKGDAAKRLADLLVRTRPPSNHRAHHSLSAEPSAIIDSLVIIDRNVDMVTPLLTQLTYEGLLDEFYGINNSQVRIDSSILSNQNSPSTASTSASTSIPPAVPLAAGTSSNSAGQKRKYHLKSADALYGRIRDSNFAVVGPKLSAEILRLDREYKSRHQAQTPTQLKEFVGKLGGLEKDSQTARLHTAMFEEVREWTREDQFNKVVNIEHNLLEGYEIPAQLSEIEDLIAQGAPIQLVLRLLCLVNVTTGGIKAKTLDNLKREFLQTYGYAYVPFLLSLASTSLITSLPIPKAPAANAVHKSGAPRPPAPPPPPFAPIRKALRLLSETDDANPADISYVYSGYAPLSVRLVQCVAQKSAVLSSSVAEKDAEEGNGGAANAAASAAGGTGGENPTNSSIKPFASPISGWKGFEDALKLIPGATVDITQRPEAVGQEEHGTASVIAQPLIPRERATTTMVFFLGGCTFTEISALRWMSSQMRGRRFLIGTTGIVNGSTLLESLGDGPGVKFMSSPATSSTS